MAMFLTTMLIANFYTVRNMNRYGLELYFYDKLLVAYNIGGEAGLKEELKEMLLDDRSPRQLILAKDFIAKMESLKEPLIFLNNQVEKNKSKISFFRNLRTTAIIFMLLIFIWRLITNIKTGSKPKIN
jgi:hypothetical protein